VKPEDLQLLIEASNRDFGSFSASVALSADQLLQAFKTGLPDPDDDEYGIPNVPLFRAQHLLNLLQPSGDVARRSMERTRSYDDARARQPGAISM